MMTPISKVIFAMIAILSVVSAALVGVSALDCEYFSIFTVAIDRT